MTTKFPALCDMNKEAYVKHLEALLIDQDTEYYRCVGCNRVDHRDSMHRLDDCGNYSCCKFCEIEFEANAEAEGYRYETERERQYRQAKGY